MKKKSLIITIAILLIALVIGGSYLLKENKNKITEDEKKFKKEYESFNGTTNEKTNKKMMSITIPTENRVVYISAKEVIEKLQGGTSIIYFGFPECPWCRNLVPILLEENKEYELPIYYYNALEIRDTKHLDENGKIITDQEGTKEYQKIVELLKDYLGEYEGLNDPSIKRLYFPTVAFIKDGKVIGLHIGTVSSQKDPYQEMTKDQKKELTNTLEEYFEELSTDVCEKDSKC